MSRENRKNGILRLGVGFQKKERNEGGCVMMGAKPKSVVLLL